MASRAELDSEQQYVSMLYARLDDLREQAAARLAGTLGETGGTPQARVERESSTALYTERLAELGAVEPGLCFGRVDRADGTHSYVGRIGLYADSGDHEPLLTDWRAPAARAFYLATAVSPDGITRRRHLRTRKRRVVALDDEVLDLDEAGPGGHAGLTGEAALLAALDARRTGRMRDVVETIQAEQDAVIRSDLGGVLVVQGGPGTGKTAVALHRAAYLLYTYRRQLSRQGVLVVGPNATFLRYISQVLPALAETGVLLRTAGELYPGITGDVAEPDAVAEIKGRAAMVDVLAAAVRDRQVVPDEPVEVVVDRETLVLDGPTIARAGAVARRSRLPHNLARPLFAQEIIAVLAGQLADRVGADPLGGENLLDAQDVVDIRDELAEDPAVHAALDELWPELTPPELLTDLYASAGRIAAAAPQLTEAERQLLRREPGAGWSPADAPLLDEAAELLGEDERVTADSDDQERRERIEYAEGVLEISEGSRSMDFEDDLEDEILAAADLVDANRLADRHVDEVYRTAAERAAADRTWTFGHVIVDEAQELSAMAWRVLMRRCPSRSMTLVGDIAQTGDPAGAASWRQALAAHVGDRWRAEELSVSYRTPAEIMAVAADVLAAVDPELRPPRSVRSAGVAPWALRVEPDRLAECVAERARAAAELDGGTLGVIVPAARVAEVGRAVAAVAPGAADGELEAPVTVLTVRQAKGLEFDGVLVVDPAAIVAESPRGPSDLYVALTRATQRLGVVHPGELPAVLAGIAPLPAAVTPGR